MMLTAEEDRERFLSIGGGGDRGDRIVLRAKCSISQRKAGHVLDLVVKAALLHRWAKKAVKRAVRSPASRAADIHGVSLAPPASSAKYDYVIVGGGAAGCALAARLSEDASVTVCILEAGEDLGTFKRAAPALAGQPAMDSGADWGFEAQLGKGWEALPTSGKTATATATTEPAVPHVSPPDSAARASATTAGGASSGSKSAVIPLSRGRALGGTSALSNLLHVRGDPATYDAWAAKEGCSGWGYFDMLPYFKRSEAARVYGDRLGVRGAGGAVPVRLAASWRHLHPSTRRFLAEAKGALSPPATSTNTTGTSTTGTSADIADDTAADFIVSPASDELADKEICGGADFDDGFDYNGAVHAGAGVAQVTVNNNTRCDPAWSYLTPAVLTRPNLHVATGARVTRVIFDGDRATGVRYCCPLPRKGGGSGSGSGSSGSLLETNLAGNETRGRERRLPDRRNHDFAAAAAAGPEISVLATREVLLCAGAVCSPWLLLLSGVGPRKDLAEKGVPVVADLEGVGANLVAPAAVPCYFSALDKDNKALARTRTGAVRRAHRSWRNLLHLPLKVFQVARFVWKGRGAGRGGSLARPPVEALVHARRDSTREKLTYANAVASSSKDTADAGGDGGGLRAGLHQPPVDLQLAFSPFLPSAETLKRQHTGGDTHRGYFSGSRSRLEGGDKSDYARSVEANVLQEKDGCTVMVALTQPRSRGSVKLVSTDPMAAPEICLNLLADVLDRQTMVDGITFARAIMKDTHYLIDDKLSSHRLVQTVVDTQPRSSRTILPHLNNLHNTFYSTFQHRNSMTACTHAVAGTCLMGPAGSQAAVVDAELRVHKVSGIRIIGSAVAPVPLSGGMHSAAATIAMAERAADIIKDSRVSEEHHRVSLCRRIMSGGVIASETQDAAAQVDNTYSCGGGNADTSFPRLPTDGQKAPGEDPIADLQTPSLTEDKKQAKNCTDFKVNEGSDGCSGNSGGSVMDASSWTNLAPPSPPKREVTPSSLASNSAVTTRPPVVASSTADEAMSVTVVDGSDHWNLIEDF